MKIYMKVVINIIMDAKVLTIYAKRKAYAIGVSKKIMPHGRTTNSKEILEHCGRRFVIIKIRLYVRRRKQ